MNEKPILFSAPMVRAILDGSKTQTRRIVKSEIALDWLDNAKFNPEFVAHPENDMCKYGKVGDRLWVREKFQPVFAEGSRSIDECAHKDAALDWFSDLWQSINGVGSWQANPWVWVVEFKRLT